MEISGYVNKTPLPTPNLCRLVQILLEKARRRKEYYSKSATVPGEHDTDRHGSTDDTGQRSDNPEHDFQDSVQDIASSKFKGKALDRVSLVELTAEFKALTVAQERESRRHLGLESSPAEDASQWPLLVSDDADLFDLAPFQMGMTQCSEELFVQQNSPGSSQLGSKGLGNRANFGRDAADYTALTKPKALPEESLWQKVISSNTRSWGSITSVRGSPVPLGNSDQRHMQDVDSAAKLYGRPLITAEAQPTSAGLSTPSPPVQMTQLAWVRLANNQLVLAQVPVASQSPAGIPQPVQALRVSAPSPAGMAQPVQALRVSAPSPAGMAQPVQALRVSANPVGMAQPVQALRVSAPSPAGIPQPVQALRVSAPSPAGIPQPVQALRVSAPSPAGMAQPVQALRVSANPVGIAQPLQTLRVSAPSPAGMAQPVQALRVSANPVGIAQPVQALGVSAPSLAPAKPSWTSLAAVSPEEHKQMIGERLCTQVQQMYPGLTNKITGMLLEVDNKELLRLLESPELLRSTVTDAVKILQQQVMMTPRLTLELLQPFPSAQQKQILGERLYPRVQNLHPNQAGKITGMLLTLDNQKVLQLLEDPEMLKERVEEAVAVLLQAHQQQLLGQEVPVTDSLFGDPATREDVQMWDFCARQSQTGSRTGEPLLSERLKTSAVFLRDRVQEQKFVNDGDFGESDQETSGVTGEQPLWGNREETWVEDGSEEDVSVPQSGIEDLLQKHFPREGFPGTKALATDAPGKYPQSDNASKSRSLINGVETASVSEAIPGSLSLKDDVMKTQSLGDESRNAYLARESFTETDSVSSSVNETPETRLSIHDLKPRSLTGSNGVTQSQTRNMPAEQPVPVANISSKHVAESSLEVTDTVLSQLSVSQNPPETGTPTEDILGGQQPAAKSGDASKQQVQAQDVSESQTLSGRTLESLPQTVEQKAQSDTGQILTQAAELQKEMLREQLLPVVEGMYPGMGGEICDIILTGDLRELCVVMAHPDTLQAKVAEAVAMLRARKVQQICQQGALLQSMYMQQQKQAMGQQLLSLLSPDYPKLAPHITGLLLEREHVELLQMLQMPQVLKWRVGEAVRTLQAHLLNTPLTAEALDLFPEPWQKQILAERLLPLIQNYHPDHAQQITAMILSLEVSKLLQLLENPEVLKGTVDNAVRLLPQVLAGNGTQTAETARSEDPPDLSAKDREADSACRTSDQGVQEDSNPLEKPSSHVNNVSAADSPCADSPLNTKNRRNDSMAEPATLNLSEASPLEQEHASSKSEGDVLWGRDDHAQMFHTEEHSAFREEDKQGGDVDDNVHGSSEAVTPSSECGDSQVACNAGQGVQGKVVPLTQGDLMQCGMLTQQGAPVDVFEAVAHLQQQKQVVGQQLLSLISPDYPKLAPHITGLLLEREHVELLQMLQMPQVLKWRVGEAVRTLQAHLLNTPLTAEVLDLFPEPLQKQMVGEQLFPQVQRLQPEVAAKITGMLLDLDNTELIRMLNSPGLLQTKVDEASAMLYLFHRDWGEKSKTEEAASHLGEESTTSVLHPDKITSDDGETAATVCSHEEE